MTQTKPLTDIIWEVAEQTTARAGYEQRIIIDARTGAVTSPTWLNTLAGQLRYFIVANTNDPRRTVSGTKQLKYKEVGEEIVFAIDYCGGCAPGHEATLAQFFYSHPQPEDAMREALARWLIQYFSSGGRTIDHFYAERQLATLELVTNAAQELGLELIINLRVDNLEQLETLEVGPLLVTSRLSDSDEEEGVWLRVELEVDQQRLFRALLNQHKPLSELLKKAVKQCLADRVTLQMFYGDLNSEQIKQDLRVELNRLLQTVGRHVTFISLKPDGSVPPSPYKGETIIQYKHHEYPEPIEIKVSVLMTPHDIARYRASGSPDLPGWLNRNLREVIELVLFGVPYVDLLLNFSDLKTQISDQMNDRAANIGYRIEQLMTMLFVEPFTWLTGIDIEITSGSNNGALAEAMFETNIAGFLVGLEIFLTARVKDLRGIAHFLSSKPDVPKRMKEAVVRLVQKVLHATHPERFYMRYSEIDRTKYPHEDSLEAELQQKIESLLNAQFNSELVYLVLKPTETAITQKLELVSRASHEFAATAELGNTPGAPAIVVQGSFIVEAVCADGWRTFSERDISVEALLKRIQASIRASLKCMPDYTSIFVEENGLDKLIAHCLVAAKKLIQDEFGVSVTLTTVSWDWDDRLKQMGRQRSNEDLTAVQKRISNLREMLLDMYENGASEEDIHAIKASISRLRSFLPNLLTSSVGVRELQEPLNLSALPKADSSSHES
jgi:hypothetical protein